MIDFDPKQFIKALSELKITSHQFLLCWFIELKDVEMLKFYKESVQAPTVRDIDDLIDRGFLITTNPNNYDIVNLVVTPAFSENYIIDATTAFEQLLDTLPKYMVINGVRRFTLTGDRNEQEFIYNKYIKNNKQKHEEVLRKTRIFTKRVNSGEEGAVGSEKYVKNRLWELIQDEDNNLRSTQFNKEV